MEAARRNRARVEALRERGGAASVFTDADLRAGRRLVPDSPPGAADRAPEDYDLPIREPALGPVAAGGPGEDTVEADTGEPTTNAAERRREIAARETEIRERLLDLEASLTAIGASGLPYAQRDPNRFQSPLEAGRLRSERRELEAELEALAAELALLR